MRETDASRPVVSLTLALGILVPAIYYGIQAAAAPTYPGFSVLRVTASELGSDRSPAAFWFNRAIMLQGAATIAAATGIFAALRRFGTSTRLAGLTAAAVALNGVQTLWAGWFPMPDPRHGGHPAFIVGMLLMPLLLAATMWRIAGATRWYFVGNLVLLAGCVPFMSGATGLDLNEFRGLLQRVFTLAIFPPIAVACAVLLQRLDGQFAASEEHYVARSAASRSL
jgi:hypothetical membrane protein